MSDYYFSKIFTASSLSADQFQILVQLCLKHFPFLGSEISYELHYLHGFSKSIYDSDFKKIRHCIERNPEGIKKLIATLTSQPKKSLPKPFLFLTPVEYSLDITFRPVPSSSHPWLGFQIIGRGLSKKEMFALECELAGLHSPARREPIIHGLGSPLEVLAVFIDMRGFSEFCESTRIESPYVSSVISTFLEAARDSFDYKPELIKPLGDGVLAVWEIRNDDRELALTQCIHGLKALQNKYKYLQAHPQFLHGMPRGIGAGIAVGFASVLGKPNDFYVNYVGRPLNVASRLCSECEFGFALVENTNQKLNLGVEKIAVKLKTFGSTEAWKVALINK